MPITDSAAILSVLFLVIAVTDWLCKKTFLRHAGTALMVILFTALVANLGIIPASTPSTPVYDGIFGYVAPLSIFWMLLNINLSSLKLAGKPMLMMFAIGSFATMAGAFVAMLILDGPVKIGDLYYAIGGMYTGTYTGGSINFNAVAINYKVSKEGGLFAAATVADNLISTIWVVATLVIPKFIHYKFPKYGRRAKKATDEEIKRHKPEESEPIRPLDLAIIFFLGLGAMELSKWLAATIPVIPNIIWLTTLALLLAQIPFINQLKGHKTMGILSIYLFLAVVGAYCDIPALIKDGQLALTLLAFVTILIIVHGIIVYGLGALLKQDIDIISIASQANVGGTATAMALAKSLNRNELVLPGILVGALGNASGTYLGIFMSEIFKSIGG